MKRMIYILLVLALGATIYYFYPEAELPKGRIVDRIEVFKSKRKMMVYSGSDLLKIYAISLGKNPIGHKEFEGDCRTPEGVYIINDKNPNSGYHKNLGISYPNKKDVAHAKALGKNAGGHIKIHGLRNGRCYISKWHRWKDWTAGCIAVTNDEVDELFESVKIGAAIEIHP
ncbi:MAG TPA: L,D-transpeptidase family protein [Flavobacterium sp.]|nr:L,D-transpeptidase family protein [Flavobacterium sp.]